MSCRRIASRSDNSTTRPTSIGWSSDPGSILTNNFTSVYGGASLFIGGNFFLSFTTSAAVLNYIPSAGTAAALTANMQNPTSSSAGIFGGDVLALQIDVDYSDAGKLGGTTGYRFGDLTLCNMTPAMLNNVSVRNYAAIVNALLGGGSSGGFTTADILTLDPITEDIASAFQGGSLSTFAQQHLVHGSCGWQNGDFVTYNQTAWGAGGAANPTLVADYGTVYASTAGGFLIGTASGFTALWTDVSILSAYLPAIGNAAVLNANITDAVSSASGVFGGDVAALKLNIDFNDTGFLKGTQSAKFGDLTMCTLTPLSALNGTTVRQFLATVNTALGGVATGYAITDLDELAIQLNIAFFAGTPSGFAQAHLVNGACP